MRKTGFILISLFILAACNDEDSTSRLRVVLVDSPGDYLEVNVDIQGVAVHSNSEAGETDDGWVELQGSNVGVQNLLNYTGGTELTLADTDFPSGMISQIRLMLGENNSVVIEQEDESTLTKDLITPSGQESGLKLLVNTNLTEGITYEFKLDFDAAKSVVETGAETYILQPVIKVITEARSGAIAGSVEPSGESVAVNVMNGDEIVATSYAPADKGAFLVPGVPEGNYTVEFDPGESSEYQTATLENVSVALDEVTDVGTITLELK